VDVPAELPREPVLTWLLVALTALAVGLCAVLAAPFFPAIAWALALAVIGRPLHERIARHVPNEHVAAGIAVAIVAVLIVAPATAVTRELLAEAAAGMDAVAGDGTGTGNPAVELWPRLARLRAWLGAELGLRGALDGGIVQAVGSWLSSLVSGSMWAGAELLLALFILFFFLRDHRAALRLVRSLIPVTDAEANRVFTRVAATIRATVQGTLLVAAVQGVLGGLMFWWLGLPAPVMWGVVMALLAVVPVLGAFVVWAPVAAFLALEGSWTKALALAGWGTIVVGLIDNLLYPVLVGSKLRMHTLPVFVAVVGGVITFGASGVILGPVVLAVMMALLDIWRERVVPVADTSS
jgi:predicted PurR-regulated permease PerM